MHRNRRQEMKMRSKPDRNSSDTGDAATKPADVSSRSNKEDINKTEVDLTKLKKKELLEIMLKQGEEIDSLRAEVERLNAELEARQIDVARVGSLAEASLAVTDIFKEADKAAMTYLTNLKRMAEGGLKK